MQYTRVYEGGAFAILLLFLLLEEKETVPWKIEKNNKMTGEFWRKSSYRMTMWYV